LNDTSDRFFLCPNKQACRGDSVGISDGVDINENIYNPTLASGSCEKGYTGILCSECDKDYGLTQAYLCSSCDNNLNYFSFTVKLILRLTIFCYSIWKGIHLTQNLKFKQYDPRANDEKSWNLAGTNSLIKIFLNHSHILYTLMTFPFEWPDFFNEIFSLSFGVFSPDTGQALSFECVLKKLGIKLPLVYFQLLVILSLPWIIASFVVLYFGIRRLRRRKKMNREIDHNKEIDRSKFKHHAEDFSGK
jgi:hypothetical protein